MRIARHWGITISGPLLAVIGIAGGMVALVCRDNQPLAAKIAAYSAGISGILAVTLCVWWAQYSTWRDERRELLGERRKNEKPSIKGEFYDLKIYSLSDEASYGFTMFIRNDTSADTSIKHVLVRTIDLDGKPEQGTAKILYRAEPIILSKGIGQTVHAAATVKLQYFVDTFTVVIVDSFGKEHKLSSRDQLPFPGAWASVAT